MKNKILFICKHNIFRSRVAEEYAKKLNIYDVKSAGLFSSKEGPRQEQIDVAKKHGLDIHNESKTISVELLRERDKIVVVADDVPKSLFVHGGYDFTDKTEFWGIEDINEQDVAKTTENIINKIKNKIDKLDLDSKNF